MGSLITAVRSLVVAGIAATPEFSTPDPETNQTPDVSFGWKANWQAREKVWTGNAEFEHSTASLRATKTFRDEQATFELVLLISGISQTEEQVSDRMDVIGGAVEDWCATHANWDSQITGLLWVAIEGRGSQTALFNDKGVLLERIYPITYRARLT
jgi:hypothetical protein